MFGSFAAPGSVTHSNGLCLCRSAGGRISWFYLLENALGSLEVLAAPEGLETRAICCQIEIQGTRGQAHHAVSTGQAVTSNGKEYPPLGQKWEQV